MEQQAPAALFRVAAEGRDKRGGHEAVHEIKLLGAGDANTAGYAEGEGVAGDRSGCALHRHRRLKVQIPPPTALIGPSQPPHPPPTETDPSAYGSTPMLTRFIYTSHTSHTKLLRYPTFPAVLTWSHVGAQ